MRNRSSSPGWGDRWLRRLSRNALDHPILMLGITLALCIPALMGVRRLGLDTDLKRLLPQHSRAAAMTRTLGRAVSDGGYFTVILHSEDRELLVSTVRHTAGRIENLEGVRSVEFRYPFDFIRHYRYLLVPSSYLDRIFEHLLSIEAEYSPFAENLLDAGERDSGEAQKAQDELKRLIDRYADLSEYHQNEDGTVMGIFIRPHEGFTNLDATQSLYLKLRDLAAQVSRESGVWADVGGSQINNLREYNVVISDLQRSGLLAAAAIFLVLVVSFRSFSALPILISPLAVGMLWAFSLVPPVIGDLNIITAFLLVILFGMGIDYTIHLLKRFQQELLAHPLPQALEETLVSTGRSVIISGLTTALPLFILSISDFKGFSEFGIIGGGAIFILLVALLMVMPPLLVLAERRGWIKAQIPIKRKIPLPSGAVTLILSLLLVSSLAAAFLGLRFDYDFNRLGVTIPQSQVFRSRHRAVYSRSMSPGAVYVVPDLETLDVVKQRLSERMSRSGSTLQRIASIRDLSPDEEETRYRNELIDMIREELEGAWVERLSDDQIRQWVEDFRVWQPVRNPPGIDQIPDTLKRSLMTRDGSENFVLGVYPNISRRNGREAMRFTEELYAIDLPDAAKGPVGEMPIFAEILWLVTSEGPLVVILTLLGVILIVFLGSRSLRDTGWMVFPLLGGMGLTLGIMAAFNLKLNFFNVVTIPALLGMGVDHGVHFYRRWKELRGDTARTQQGLFIPLSTCTLTTMMGYAGMAFANHAGMQSIGKIACLGLGCIWVTSLILFPGILSRMKPPNGKGKTKSAGPER